LAVDFRRALALAALAGSFLLRREILASVRTPSLGASHRAAGQSAGRRRWSGGAGAGTTHAGAERAGATSGTRTHRTARTNAGSRGTRAHGRTSTGRTGWTRTHRCAGTNHARTSRARRGRTGVVAGTRNRLLAGGVWT